MSQLLKRRIAVFGLGDIAVKAYLPIVANHLQIEPILCTRNKENLIRIASQYRITETYANLDELIEAKPDAIMVHSAPLVIMIR
jgi:virulence factor